MGGTGGTGATAGAGATGGASGAGNAGTAGSPTAGSGGGGLMGDPGCEASCAKIVEAGCDVFQGLCVADCETLLGPCDPELDAYNFCVADTGTVSCATGMPEITGCDMETAALDECLVCAPSGLDDDCNVCVKAQCCAQFVAWVTAPDIDVFYPCYEACTTSACLNGCIAASPVAGEAFITVAECATGPCATECTAERRIPPEASSSESQSGAASRFGSRPLARPDLLFLLKRPHM
jgi:hypothetical protein